MFTALKILLAAVLKKVGWVIRKLGLWVPLTFCAIFLLTILFTRTPFSSVKGMFFVGLIVTTAVGLGMSIFLFMRRVDKKIVARKRTLPPEKKSEGKLARLVKRKKGKDEEQEKTPELNAFGASAQPIMPTYPMGYMPTYPVQMYPQMMQPMQPMQQPMQYPIQPTYAQPQPQPRQEYRPYVPTQMQSNGFYRYPSVDARLEPAPVAQPKSDEFIPYPSTDRANNYSARDYTPPRYDEQFGSERRERETRDYGSGLGGRDRLSFDVTGEQPKIYRTRMDESVLIYEYADRIEFYRTSPEGKTLLDTQYKNR